MHYYEFRLTVDENDALWYGHPDNMNRSEVIGRLFMAWGQMRANKDPEFLFSPGDLFKAAGFVELKPTATIQLSGTSWTMKAVTVQYMDQLITRL